MRYCLPICVVCVSSHLWPVARQIQFWEILPKSWDSVQKTNFSHFLILKAPLIIINPLPSQVQLRQLFPSQLNHVPPCKQQIYKVFVKGASNLKCSPFGSVHCACIATGNNQKMFGSMKVKCTAANLFRDIKLRNRDLVFGIWYRLWSIAFPPLQRMFIGPPQASSDKTSASSQGAVIPMKRLLHSCKYSTGANRTICQGCNCNCQFKRKAPPTTIFNFQHLESSQYTCKYTTLCCWQPPDS